MLGIGAWLHPEICAKADLSPCNINTAPFMRSPSLFTTPLTSYPAITSDFAGKSVLPSVTVTEIEFLRKFHLN